MAFVGFDFIENFFFISLGITFSLIILLVYHFKERITSMERKGDTMYELITNVVKELQFMKKLNAYYETLFQQSALPVNLHASTEPTNTLLHGSVPLQFTYETPNVVTATLCTGIAQIPVEINELMGMIQNALVSGISQQEPQKFAPYYEPETENEGPDSNHYKPVVVETDGEVDAQIIDVVAIEENTLERTSDKGYEKIESVHTTIDAVELDVNDLEGEILKNQEQEQPVVSSTANSGEEPSVPVPEPTDKKQTREVYRKMNITQLRGIAVAAGISTDTTKMKKNELIQLLENLEE